MSVVGELERRLRQVENALLDAQGRLPGLRAEVSAIRVALAEHASDHASGVDELVTIDRSAT